MPISMVKLTYLILRELGRPVRMTGQRHQIEVAHLIAGGE